MLELKLEDVSCTEAWITLKSSNLQIPNSISIKQNNQIRMTINLTTHDTLLYIDSLLPKQTYTYQVSGIWNQVSSNELSVITMDTTSHNFTWQTFTFWQHSNSVLYDVAIINENNIWAVGRIYMNDSLGNPDLHAYNAVHWDGNQWEMKKISGQGGWACRTVFVFSANDIWFEGTIHWDGSKYTVKNNGWTLMPNGDGWQVNKLWGSSSNDLYAVGNGGNIAHWDGVKWSRIESWANVDLVDVWNTPDGNIVWACGYFSNKPGTYLMRSTGGNFESAYDGTANRIRILTDTISGRLPSVYTPNSRKIFVGTTTGVYSATATTKGKGSDYHSHQAIFPGCHSD